MEKRIYFDYNAAAPMIECAEIKFKECMEYFGNPSSIHYEGRKSRGLLSLARKKISSALGCGNDEIFFCSGATESNNMAVKSFFFENRNNYRNKIIVSQIEHHSILNSCRFLEKFCGAEIAYVPVDSDGIIDFDYLEKNLDDKTILVSLCAVNNETGVIQDTKTAAKIIEKFNKKNSASVKFHIDAVQALGKITIIPYVYDCITFSGHKIYGPKGSGFFYLKKETLNEPFIHGGSQEFNMRAGTENLPALCGMAEAVEFVVNEKEFLNKHYSKLIEVFISRLKKLGVDFVINGHLTKRVSNTVNISFIGTDKDTLVMNLDMNSISASAGSACAAGAVTSSHVISAMNPGDDRIRSAVRFSAGKFNTENEMVCAADTIYKIIKGNK
jgi:cysteine desulfurase